ncbi:FecR family protein [Oxalobacteraceae bacterium A2-2]
MPTIDESATAWVLRSLGRELSAQEQRDLDAWRQADIRHQGAYLRATAIQHGLRRLGAGQPAALRPEGAPARGARQTMPVAAVAAQPAPLVEVTPVAPQPGQVAPARRLSRRAWASLGGLAAGIAALGLALPMLTATPGHAEFRTVQGELRKVPLPDQSIASINSGSRMELKYTDDTRAVVLDQGEAWFEVARNKARPFIVEAGDVRARAVGTAFSVRRLSRGAEVLVTEGTVEVWSVRGGEHRRISAGESAYLSGAAEAVSVSRQPREVARKLAWREGKLVFVDQTLRDAVADFNRYSVKKIVIADPALLERKFVGQYPVAAPEDFAHDVSAYLGVPLQISADRIVIGAARGRQPAG